MERVRVANLASVAVGGEEEGVDCSVRLCASVCDMSVRRVPSPLQYMYTYNPLQLQHPRRPCSPPTTNASNPERTIPPFRESPSHSERPSLALVLGPSANDRSVRRQVEINPSGDPRLIACLSVTADASHPSLARRRCSQLSLARRRCSGCLPPRRRCSGSLTPCRPSASSRMMRDRTTKLVRCVLVSGSGCVRVCTRVPPRRSW